MSQELYAFAEAACAVARELTALFIARSFDYTIPQEVLGHFTETSAAIRAGTHRGWNVGMLVHSMRLLRAAQDVLSLLLNLGRGTTSLWMTQLRNLTNNIRIGAMLVNTWRQEVLLNVSQADCAIMVSHGLLPNARDNIINNYTEIYYGAMGIVGFAARIGQLDQARAEVARLGKTEWVREDINEHFEAVNACLPIPLKPLRGGTPLQKLQRLHAFAHASPHISAEIREGLRHALEAMERKMGGLSPHLAAHTMIAATQPQLTKPGRVNLMQALDEDYARQFILRLMLRDAGDPSDTL
jgi:hypothetical protein